MKFRLNGADHQQGGRVYTRGEIIESKADLVAMFGKKFERVHEEPTAPVVVPAALPPLAPQAAIDAATDAGAAGIAAPPAGAVPSPLGDDVTAEFANAADKGLLVFKKGKNFLVAKATAPAEAICDEPLNKTEAKAFIAEHE